MDPQTQEPKPINPRRKVSPERYRPKQKREAPDILPTRVNGEQYRRENPYKANQYTPDPRQDVCWENYLRGWLVGRPNAKQAALDAGYSDTTSSNVTNLPWFRERHARLKRKDFLSKSERNIEKILDIDFTKLDELGQETIDIDRLKTVADMTKFVASTLGKDEGYSSKSTVDQKVSGEVQIKAVNYADTVIEPPKEAKIIDVPAEEVNG